MIHEELQPVERLQEIVNRQTTTTDDDDDRRRQTTNGDDISLQLLRSLS